MIFGGKKLSEGAPVDPAIYTTFKGAGAPSNPPPQRPNTNPSRERILELAVLPFIACIVLLVFAPVFIASDALDHHVVSALCCGLLIAVYDWIIEAWAYKKGLWFCYGGYQKIGRIDFKHVPIDMILEFIGIGFGLAILSYYPALLTSWGWALPFTASPYDLLYLPGFLVVSAMVGAFGDFLTKKSGVWMNGPTWTYWKCAFLAWLPLLTSGIVIERLVFMLL